MSSSTITASRSTTQRDAVAGAPEAPSATSVAERRTTTAGEGMGAATEWTSGAGRAEATAVEAEVRNLSISSKCFVYDDYVLWNSFNC